MGKERAAYAPGVYARLAALIAERGEQLGYAIAVHGSMRRDLDLIAAPWTDQAVSGEELVRAVCVTVGGYVIEDGTCGGRWNQAKQEWEATEVRNPEAKPHGRMAWNIQLGGGAFIDLSIMPRQVTE